MEKDKVKKSLILYSLLPVILLGVLFVLLLDYAHSQNFENIPADMMAVLCGSILFLYTKNVFLYVLNMYRLIDRIVKGTQTEFTDRERDYFLEPFGELIISGIRKPLEREYAALLCKKQAEVDALQSQINPHFLYNTLDSIRGRAVIEHADGVANMIEALAKFFRYNISRSGNMVTLAEELKNINTYMEIQNFRFGERFKLIKEFPEDNFNEIMIPKLTLQPIVENAIFHGLEQKEEQGIITVRVTVTADRTLLRISDNGVGMTKDQLKRLNDKLSEPLQLRDSGEMGSSHGIAIKNVSDRIKLCFGEQYGLVIYSAPDIGTDVEIRMPLIQPV